MEAAARWPDRIMTHEMGTPNAGTTAAARRHEVATHEYEGTPDV